MKRAIAKMKAQAVPKYGNIDSNQNKKERFSELINFKDQDIEIKDEIDKSENLLNELSKNFEIVKKKEQKEDQIMSNRILPEFSTMKKTTSAIKHKISSFENLCRNNLFTDNLYMKQTVKNYLKKSKALGYNEFLLEIVFRYLAIYQEIKGERSMKGQDIDGRQFWNTSLFEELKKDLIYMTLPEVEVDSGSLISLLGSFQRLKYKDYEVLHGLSLKLILGCRNPAEELLDQGSNNPFSAVELLKYYHDKYSQNDAAGKYKGFFNFRNS